MPGHTQKSGEPGEISETASTISTDSKGSSRGDWETVSNRSTTTPVSLSPLASLISPVEPLSTVHDATKKAKSDKPPKASRSSSKVKSDLPDESRIKGDKGRDKARDKDSVKGKGKRREAKTDNAPCRTTLEEYFHQQSKLFSNVEKRYNAFQQKVKDEPRGIGQAEGSATHAFHSSAKLGAKTSSAAGKKKKAVVNPDAMPLAEAARVLRALEISNPSSAYSLTLSTRTTKSSLPLRGRLSFPVDPRKSPEVILVFADPSSPSATLAKGAGAAYVGGEELFPQILSGAIAPTKCLATPGLMPAVQQKLARYLGPKGLMPVAKRGGVGEGEDLAGKVREAAGGMEWKGDKLGVVRAPVARMTFPLEAVEENVRAFISAVKEGSATAAAAAQDSSSRKKQPSGIISARIETTQGPSIELSDVL